MNRRTLVFGLLLIGLCGALYVAAQRIRVESRNRAVEIVLDYDEIQQWLPRRASTPSDVMKRFKDAGATSVAITEETFGDAIKTGNVIIGDGNYGIRDEAGRIAATCAWTCRTRGSPCPRRRAISPAGLPSTLRIWGRTPAKYLEELPDRPLRRFAISRPGRPVCSLSPVLPTTQGPPRRRLTRSSRQIKSRRHPDRHLLGRSSVSAIRTQ